MTDRPYTDADLRAEAARQHHELTEDPDFGGIGEMMEDAFVASVETEEDGSARTWSELLDPEGDGTKAYDTAMREISDLLSKAADVSEWAITLGVAGLTPHKPMGWRCTTTGWDVAIQVATSADLTTSARDELLAAIKEAVDGAVKRVLKLTDTQA